ncbi:MAG: barstar family protein [Actinomycetia bacterium]|nr:barstar family protein [Actinomycetes bacterium]
MRGVILPADSKRGVITAVYRAVGAPSWAAPNLDALADVLRDLSWLPARPVRLDWWVSARLPAADRATIAAVLATAQAESAGSGRPITVWRREAPVG